MSSGICFLQITELGMKDADAKNLELQTVPHETLWPTEKIPTSSMRAVLWQDPQRLGVEQSKNFENKRLG